MKCVAGHLPSKQKLIPFYMVLLLLFSLVLGHAVYADAPGIPHQFYGTVTINGSLAAAGYTITAKVAEVEVAAGTTDSSGRYGYDPLFMVATTAGATIDFYVNDVKAAQTDTFVAGDITNLPLTVTGTVPPPGSVSETETQTQTETETQTQTQTQTQTETQTQTQTQTTTTGAVSTSVLGSSGSFSVSNGVVSSPVSIASTNGNLSLSLASNTAVNLQGSQNLTVTQLASTPAPPSGSKAINAYSFGPDNATFSPAATVTIKYDSASLPADVSESNLYIALLQNNSWSELNSTVNTSAKTVSAQISHFSTYAVLGKTSTATEIQANTAAFSTSDLAVSPASAKAGEMVTVSVRVVNSGASAATRTVVLKINDQDEAQKNVTLAAAESKVVSFNVSRGDPGNYKVSVDGQSDSFQVTGSSGGQPVDMSTIVIIIFAAGILLIIFLVIKLIMRQRSSSGY